MIALVSPGRVELVETPTGIAEVEELMGVENVAIVRKSLHVGGPWGIVYAVLMPDDAVKATRHRIVGPVTLRGTCLIGRCAVGPPYVGDISVADVRRLGLA